MDTTKIGKFIEHRRKIMKLTQKQLGDIVGVSNGAVSKWECGNNLPDIAVLIPVSEALGVSVEDLLRCRDPEDRLKEEGENIVQEKTVQDNMNSETSKDSLEDIPEENNDIANEDIDNNEKKISNITFAKVLRNLKILIGLLILSLIITLGFLPLLILGLYEPKTETADELKLYKIVCDDRNFNIDGYIIFNKSSNIVKVNKIYYAGIYKGTDKELKMQNIKLYLKIGDKVIYKAHTENEKEKKFDLNEILSSINLNKDDTISQEYKISNLESFFSETQMIIECYDDNKTIKIFELPISLNKNES